MPVKKMTSPAPRVTIARPSRSNGVLSIPASATQRRNVPTHEAQPSRAASTRLKIIIRRLPPGLTQLEFEEALGDDWKTRGDKVDWAIYKDGKVSKEYTYIVPEPVCCNAHADASNAALQNLQGQAAHTYT